jgi:hypothetical protein
MHHPGKILPRECKTMFMAFTEKGGLYVIRLTQRFRQTCDDHPWTTWALASWVISNGKGRCRHPRL